VHVRSRHDQQPCTKARLHHLPAPWAPSYALRTRVRID
jgi:hypothetical protein